MKRGISLIVLIITIIVIIILAGAVILNLTNNNPIDSARKARLLNDVDTFKSELSLYELNKMSDLTGNYNPKTLNADKNSVSEDGVQDTNRKISDVITSMNNTRYTDILEIISGELVYVGDNEKESNWLDGIIESENFKINLSLIPDETNIKGKVTLSGLLVDETKIEYYRIYLSQTQGTYPDTPNIEITDKKKEIEFDLQSLNSNSNYYIKVELKMSNEPDARVLESGKIITKLDSVAPNTPQIAVPEYSNNYTIDLLTVILLDNEGGSGVNKEESRYIIDKVATNYTEQDDIWDSAVNFSAEEFIQNTASITSNVDTDGEYYLHVLAIDNAGNKKSAVSSRIIVDTTVPNEAEITVPQTATNNTVQATVNLSDNTGGSGIDLSKCKYIYSAVSYPYGDTETIWDTATVFTSEVQTITVTSSTNEVYYLHVLLVDKAGNRREVLSSGVTTNTDTPIAPVITGTIATNTWINQNVTLTINEVTSPGITRYEYSINGGTWQTYNSTNKIVVTSDGTYTIKARAVNNVGTIGAESEGYIVKIDRVLPTISATYKKADGTTYTSDTWTNQSVIITATGNDNGGSGISKYQVTYNGSEFSDLMGNTVTLSTTGRTGIWVRAIDNTGNVGALTSNFIVSIDKTEPSISLSQASNGNYSKIITASIADNESGIMIKKWAQGSRNAAYFASSGTEFTGTTFEVTNNDTYTVYAKNNAGVEKIQTISIQGIWFLKTFTGSSGLSYGNGATLDSNGNIILGVNTAVQYGPYVDLVAGTYEITTIGENLDKGNHQCYYGYGTTEGRIDVTMNINTNTSTTYVYTIILANDSPKIESVIYNWTSGSYTIKVNSVQIKRIQ